MDQVKARDILSGRRGGAAAVAFRALTWAASKPYGWLMRLRRWGYRAGLLPVRSARAPVICVGNVTTGGTGKTPMVAWIVERLKDHGRRPAILLRGYKATAGRSDEAELLRQTAGVAVIVNADRVAAAEAACADGADVLVMDDGFQHLRLGRDLDVVLIDATNPFGFGHCLPRGLLREPLSALRSAHALVITRSDQVEPEALADLRLRLARAAPNAAVCTAVHELIGIIDPSGRRLPVSELAGTDVCAFCGIANPGGFFATLERAGARVLAKLTFDDHVAYDKAVLGRIARAVGDVAADVLATTAKDRVKIADPSGFTVPLWTVEVRMRVVEGQQQLLNAIMRAAGNLG